MFGKLVCIAPEGTLADHSRSRRRSWDFHPSQFSSCPGEPKHRRFASGRCRACLLCLHMADPHAVCLMPSSIIFRRGTDRSNSCTDAYPKEADNHGRSNSASGFFPGTSRSRNHMFSGSGPILPWAFSSSRFSDVTRRVRTGSTPYAPSIPGHRFRRHAAHELFVDVRKFVRLGVIFACDVPAIGGPSAY